MDIHSVKNNIIYRNLPLIFLDLETTGLNVQRCEIIEIGAIRVTPKEPFEIEEELSLKIEPLDIKKADKEALKINGYSKDKWKDAMPLEKALKILEKFSKNGIMVGYNISFDWAFLHKAYFEMGKEEPFHYHRLDVLAMAYLRFFRDKNVLRFNLSNICKVLKVLRGNKHQALEDARATYLVFKKLLEIK
jgi:DNA polymerase III epsilon subunit-like protein